MDNQLPAALARWLAAQGADAVHVLELALDTTPDVDIWSRASTEARIVVSKDEDFFDLANRPGDTGRLLWVRMATAARRRCSPVLKTLGQASSNRSPLDTAS